MRRITLHVHTPNETAIAFYQRHGFEISETLPNYYRRLQPPSAFLLHLELQWPPC